MNFKKLIVFILLGILATGCAATLAPAKITKNGDIGDYKFVVLPKTVNLRSSSGSVYGNEHGVYGGTSSNEINPSSIIEGVLLKRGLFSTDGVTNNNEDKTLIVKYGESGRRKVAGGFGGYAVEVTIVLLSAKTSGIMFSCVAEGQGTSETDDIREAIHRCLSGL